MPVSRITIRIFGILGINTEDSVNLAVVLLLPLAQHLQQHQLNLVGLTLLLLQLVTLQPMHLHLPRLLPLLPSRNSQE